MRIRRLKPPEDGALHVSFTGSEVHVTPEQERNLHTYMRTLALPVVGHHGDCVEGDAKFHAHALGMGWELRIHPPRNPAKRAFCRGASIVYPEKEYMARNDDVAGQGSVLLACPLEAEEVVRSGTWSTVRRARKLGRKIILLLPDGRILA